MKRAIARLLVPLLRILTTGARQQRHRPEWDTPYTYPYSRDHAGGPTAYCTGGRPPRGEDSPLVRPYLVAYERQVAEEAARTAAEERRRLRTLRFAAHGVDVRPRSIHGAEVAA
ncbi:hypothetical protein [Streptomyces clavifer]|uniref:hypothetical protein n=1 Tax=Streptomyces clavifer TaxID=68188 RepID=UPI0034187AC6